MDARTRIRDAILALMPQEGVRQLGDSVFVVRRDRAALAEHRFDRPLASLLAQGSKRTVIGAREYELSQGQILTVAVDMPSSSLILDASPETPLLTLFFHIDPHIIAELLLEMGSTSEATEGMPTGVAVSDADTDFLETATHLVTALGGEFPDKILGRMLLRQLHYLLLKCAPSDVLSTLYGSSLPGQRLFQAIDYLKRNLNRQVRLSDLAKTACMSESSLYRHFKSVTGLSPLQYHKQLRLHEARRIMLTENERAATAAFRVGFESIPQFNREYKRLFGQPPLRDTRNKK